MSNKSILTFVGLNVNKKNKKILEKLPFLTKEEIGDNTKLQDLQDFMLEKMQPKKLASNMQQAASKLDPWASQRPFYQQQAQQAVTNPYDSPIVKAQIEQLQREQDIKDAQAGRRSNMLTSSPALMAAMAQVAQNYQNQMAQQGGAGINPSAAANMLSSAANANASGYLSPIAQLFGYKTDGNTNQYTLNDIIKAAQGAK